MFKFVCYNDELQMRFRHTFSILLPIILTGLSALLSCSGVQDSVIEIQLAAPVLQRDGASVSTNSIGVKWAAAENAARGYNCTVEGKSAPSSPVTVKSAGGYCELRVDGLLPAMSYTVTVHAIGYEEHEGSSRIVYLESGNSQITIQTYEEQEPDDDPDDDPDKPGPVSGKACRGWFELPAQKDDDHNGIDDSNSDLYYSWTMRADMPRIRNFSSCYSKGRLHPLWVAAPMHESYHGGSRRNEAYKDDSEIKCVQASKFDTYTRGHMLGSSDRTVSVPTNKQVFFYSNIGAQIGSGFNTGGGAWNKLEELVDSQWCSDTLYQVIGCIFEDFTDAYGSTIYKKTGTSPEGTFQVPTAWYKVLLRTKSGKSGKRVDQCTADELKCCAFILSHKSAAGHEPSAKDMYTVEYVEKLTGLEFFVNVPNAPKSTFDPDDWL